MKRVLAIVALMCAVAVASAQVSYTDMVKQRAKHTNYVSPASLTAVDGTHKYMEIEGNNVVLYNYDDNAEGEVVFTAKHPIISYQKSPDGNLAMYEMYVDKWPRKDIYRNS